MPIAIARENSSASMSGREKATLITKIEMVRTAATLTSSEKSAEADLEGRLRLAFREARRDLAERGGGTRRDDDAAPAP